MYISSVKYQIKSSKTITMLVRRVAFGTEFGRCVPDATSTALTSTHPDASTIITVTLNVIRVIPPSIPAAPTSA